MDPADLHGRSTMHAAETPTMIPFPYGPGGPLPLDIPAEWSVEAAWPDLSGPIGDYPESLRRALDNPEGGVRFESLVGPGRKVAIVVDDPSRWTPVRDVLPEVLRRLHQAGVAAEDVSISAGVGRH